MEHHDGTPNGLDPERLDRRLKLPATKACAMCGWVMRLAGTIYECSNRACEREEAA